MFTIKPKRKDKKVINPDTLRRLPESGIMVQRVTTFWKNRKEDGDVTIEDSKKTSKKTITKKEEGDK